ncbi:MAG: acetyl-CoA decarbonylase/synthase complex subunit delta [Eubacterium sp.]|nr:acetyl-CoA decarbonylase/synthase complex subunit delta [Eubacterium sp.]
MPLKRKAQKFNASINEVEIGTGDKTVKIGGQNVLPFYSFDGNIGAGPKVGVEITDLGLEGQPQGVKDYYAGCNTIGEMAKKAAEMPGADFVVLRLEGGDPNGLNKSVEDLIAVVKEVADAYDGPLVVEGSKNVEKDTQLLPKVAEAIQGRNALIMSARDENYKAIGAAAALAYGQKVGAESAVDINLAKQLNVVMTQLGVNANSIVMNTGSAAAGYGFDYTISTFDRVKAAALGQDDKMLQMPIITPVASETWAVKESTATEEDEPEWGALEDRGVSMEVQTATACLVSGSDAVILKHPQSVAAIAKLIKELV